MYISDHVIHLHQVRPDGFDGTLKVTSVDEIIGKSMGNIIAESFNEARIKEL